jgi:arylsulfatase A-like enzyme
MPGVEMGSRRRALVQTVDLAPTLCEWFGVSAQMLAGEGCSLLPPVRDEAVEGRSALCLGDGRRCFGVRTQAFYLITSQIGVHAESSAVAAEVPAADWPRLYIKPDDIWETHDVAAQYSDTVEKLMSVLRTQCP